MNNNWKNFLLIEGVIVFVCIILGILTSKANMSLEVFWLEACGVLSGIWLFIFSSYFEKTDSEIKKTYAWECDYCGKEFKTEALAMKHEKTCKNKN